MGLFDNGNSAAEERLEKATERLKEARAAYAEAGRVKEQAARRLEGLRRERKNAVRAAKRDRFVPGGEGEGGTAVATDPVAAIDAKIEDAEAATRAHTREELDAALEEHQAALKPVLDAKVEGAIAAREAEVEALAEFGRAVAKAYAALPDVSATRRAAFAEAEQLVNAIDAGHQATSQTQKTRIRSHLKKAEPAASPAAMLGYLAARFCDFTRRPKSPTEAVWRDLGVNPASGVFIDGLDFSEFEILTLREGRIPRHD